MDFPVLWEDTLEDFTDIPRRVEIAEKNKSTLDRLMMYLEQ